MSVSTTIQDGAVLTWRSLLHIPRVPELLVFSTIQPIMFVLLFSYVFGGAVKVPGGGSYREYLMAGIFAQTMAFATGATAVGLAEDMSKGLIDRFRSLPIARSAVLVGRTAADLVRNAFILLVMVACGLVVGWHIHRGPVQAAGAFALLLLLAYAMSWIGAFIGMAVANPEVANTAGFIWLFPITFLSIAFVPAQTLTPWLRHVAEWNPLSSTVAACRELFGNPNPFAHAESLPMRHPILVSLFWSLLILAVFVPLAVQRYRRATSH